MDVLVFHPNTLQVLLLCHVAVCLLDFAFSICAVFSSGVRLLVSYICSENDKSRS